MADYRDERVDPPVARRSSGGTIIGGLLLVAAIIVGVLFATGFWSADVTKSGALPEVSVKGGQMPSVDLNSKEVVVGTKKQEIDVPKVETKKTTIDVPVVGVTDGKK